MSGFKPSNLHQGALYVFISAAGFSVKAIFAKKAYESGADPVTLLMLRLLFASPLFLLLAYWNSTRNTEQNKIRTKEVLALVALGILGYYLSSLMDFVGLSYISASLERIILFSYPTMVVILTALFFRSSLDRKDYLALIITYLGIFVVFSEELKQSVALPSDTLLIGASLIVGSAFTYALYLIGSGFVIPHIGAARFTAYSMLIATAAMLIHYVIDKGFTFPSFQDSIIWYGIAMAIISTFLPAYFLAQGIKLIGSERSSVISTIGPVSTIVLANIVLGETMTWIQVLGTLVVVAGVLIISLKNKK